MSPEELSLLVRNLPHATSLDLYRLAYATRALYNEPRRILEIRRHLHVGMTVRFFSTHEGALIDGKIVALGERDATIQKPDNSLRYPNVPYAAIDIASASAADPEVFAAAKPQSPRVTGNKKSDFKTGDMVTFENRELTPVIGRIIRMNQKTASIEPPEGGIWRVSFNLLKHIVDV